LNLKHTSKDIFGLAVENFYNSADLTPISVHLQGFDDDEIPVDYLFRNYSEMPILEKKALDLCKGNVLDVGCCAGSHSLELKKRNLEVFPIDISKKCINICQKLGLANAKHGDFYELIPKQYDTILMLMNGIGIAKSIKHLPVFFEKLKQLMHQESQVLLDSSDLIYLYDKAPEPKSSESYYGEMVFQTSYKGERSEPFPWLFLDYKLLRSEAKQHGLDCQLIYKDEHYGFLAQLRLS